MADSSDLSAFLASEVISIEPSDTLWYWWLPRLEVGKLLPSLLISTPINVNGAQQASAHGLYDISRSSLQCVLEGTHIPQTATRTVAKRSDVTNGANTIDPAKMRCATVHAVNKLGLRSTTVLTMGAMLAGGLGVKSGFSSSGDLTIHGSVMEPTKVTMENTINDMLPTRPISDSGSLDCLTSGGASYRR